jgi:hypothetical protein
MNWRVLSLALVLTAGLVVWRMIPVPSAQAEEMMKLPPGIILKTLVKADPMGIPGVKGLTAFRLTVMPGAKWANMKNEAKIWDLCYAVSGVMTVKGPDGKTSTIMPGTAYTIPANVTIPLITNTGKVPAVDFFWHVEGQ